MGYLLYIKFERVYFIQFGGEGVKEAQFGEGNGEFYKMSISYCGKEVGCREDSI